MSARFVITSEAERDLEQQADYYADRQNVDLRLRFLRVAQESRRFLATHPQVGSVHRFGRVTLLEIRWFPMRKPFEKHLIFYRKVLEGIEIIRILHAMPRDRFDFGRQLTAVGVPISYPRARRRPPGRSCLDQRLRAGGAGTSLCASAFVPVGRPAERQRGRRWC
jgi:plasmid stabilization system protein ParE